MSEERREGEEQQPRREEDKPSSEEREGQEPSAESREDSPPSSGAAPGHYVAGPGAVEEDGPGDDDLDLPPPTEKEAQPPERPAAPAQVGRTGPQAGPQQRPAPPPPRQGGYQQQQPSGPGRPPYGPPQQPPRQGAPPQQPPPYGGGGWRPPYGPPGGPGGYGPGGGPPRTPQRNRALPVIIGLLVVFVILGFVLTAVVAGTAGRTAGGPFAAIMGERIAILNVEGVIGEGPGFGADSQKLVDQIKAWKRNPNIRALVVRVNSGGGAVSATQDVYAALLEFKEETGRPIVASFGDAAASGGYYAALPADEIFANGGSITGSIGVMLSLWDFQGLQEKIGISAEAIKSGEFKDIGSGSRDMTDEEERLLTAMVIDVFEQFHESVMTGRAESIRRILNAEAPDEVTDEEVNEHLREKAGEGQIFSGRQALEIGLIDALGTLDDAVERAAELAGIDPDTRRVRAPTRPRGLFGTLGALSNRMEQLAEGSTSGEAIRIEYRMGLY